MVSAGVSSPSVGKFAFFLDEEITLGNIKIALIVIFLKGLCIIPAKIFDLHFFSSWFTKNFYGVL